MSSRGYRRHSMRFKRQLCQDIRAGLITRLEAQRQHKLASSVVQDWLTLFDSGKLELDEIETATNADYEAKIAALERKVGQLTMELDLLKKTPRLRLVHSSDLPSIISGPKAVRSDEDAK